MSPRNGSHTSWLSTCKSSSPPVCPLLSQCPLFVLDPSRADLWLVRTPITTRKFNFMKVYSYTTGYSVYPSTISGPSARDNALEDAPLLLPQLSVPRTSIEYPADDALRPKDDGALRILSHTLTVSKVAHSQAPALNMLPRLLRRDRRRRVTHLCSSARTRSLTTSSLGAPT